MAEWTTCPSCMLKHTARPDGLCPRCRTALRPGAAVPPPAAGPAPLPPAYPAAASTAEPGPAPALPTSLPSASPLPTYPTSSYDGAPAAYSVAPGPFSIGQLLSATFTTWFGTAGTVVGLAILVNLPTALLMIRATTKMNASDFRPFLAAMAVNFLLAPLELLWIARAAIRFQRSEKVELGDVLASSSSYLPALGLLLLYSLAAGLSAMTVIGIPFALFLSCAWVASIPAMAAEGLGSTRALQRSWDLTRGRRWEIFGAFFVLMLVIVAVSLVFSFLTGAIIGVATARAGASSPRTAIAVAQLLGTIIQGVVSTLLTTGTAVAYHQLRVAREGHDGVRLARVFE